MSSETVGQTMACLLIVALAAGGIGFFVWLIAYNNRQAGEVRSREQAARELAAKELADGHAGYQAALAALKASPNDPDLRQAALAWGRHYAGLTRRQQGVTVYDELAISNDIAAACAGASRSGVS